MNARASCWPEGGGGGVFQRVTDGSMTGDARLAIRATHRRACRALLYRLLNIDPNSCDGLSDYFNGVPCQLELPQSRGSPRAGGSAAVIGTGKKRKASPGSPPASASRQATIQTLNLGLFTGFANIAPGSWNDLSRRPHDAAGLQKLLHSNLRSRPALPCSHDGLHESFSLNLSLSRPCQQRAA